MKWVLLLLLIIPIAYAGDYSIVNSSQWVVNSATGEEALLTFYTADAKDKKTELFWQVPDDDCTGWTDKNLFDESNTLILDDKSKGISLKCESAKFDGMTGYYISLTDAKSINIDSYVKLGNQSFVTVYQDEKKVVFQDTVNSYYNCDEGNCTFLYNDSLQINATVTSNVSVDDYFIVEKQGDTFWGVNTSVEGAKKFNTTITSNYPIIWDGDSFAVQITEYKYYDIVLDDICEENCNFWQLDDYTLFIKSINEEYDPSYRLAISTKNHIKYNTTLNSVFFHITPVSTSPYDELIFYHSFDFNASVFYDYSINSHDLSWTGVIKSEVSPFGKALNCTGGYASAYPSFDSSTGATFSAWIRTTETDGDIVANWGEDGNLNSAGWGMGIVNGNLAVLTADTVICDIDPVSAIAFECSSSINDGTWHHVATSWRGSTNGTADCYVDGAFTQHVNVTGQGYYIYDGSETGVQISDVGICSSQNQYCVDYVTYQGAVDELMYFDRNLSLAEIQSIYQNTSTRFYDQGRVLIAPFKVTNSGDNVNVTTQIPTSYKGTNASIRVGSWDKGRAYDNQFVTMDGFKDFVDFSDTQQTIADGSNYTISLWVYNEETTQGTFIDLFGMSQSGSANNRGYGFSVSTTSWYAFVGNSSKYQADVCTAPALRTWTNYVARFNGTYIECFKNSVSTGSPTLVTLGGTYPKKQFSASEEMGGSYEVGLSTFNGSMDSVLVYNRALSNAEISSIFKANRTRNVPRDNLVGEWQFDVGYNDTSGNGYDGIRKNNTNITKVDDSLVLHLPLDGDTLDYSGRGNHGTAYNNLGSIDNASGWWNGSMTFNAVQSNGDPYILIPYSDALNITQNITISAWIYFEDDFSVSGANDDTGNGVNSGYVLAMRDENERQYGLWIQNYQFRLNTWGANANTASTSTALQNQQKKWLNLVVTLNSAGIGNLYLNGTNVTSDGTATAITPATTDIYIGARGDDTTSTAFGFNGSIDDVMVWNRVLSKTEVQRLAMLGRNNWRISDYKNLTKVNNTHANNNYAIDNTTTHLFVEAKLNPDVNSFFSPVLRISPVINVYTYAQDVSQVIYYEPPSWFNVSVSPKSPQSYTQGLAVSFNITWINATNTTFVLDGTNYTMTNNSNVYNVTIIGMTVGNHNYYFWANNSNGSNQTSVYTYTITEKPKVGGGGAGCIGFTQSCSNDGDCCDPYLCIEGICQEEKIEEPVADTSSIPDIADRIKQSKGYLKLGAIFDNVMSFITSFVKDVFKGNYLLFGLVLAGLVYAIVTGAKWAKKKTPRRKRYYDGRTGKKERVYNG